MVSQAGHIALILPGFARQPILHEEIGIYRYLGGGAWHTVPCVQRRRLLHWIVRTPMNAYTSAEAMHRFAKRAMDNGTAQAEQEAEAPLRGYRIVVVHRTGRGHQSSPPNGDAHRGGPRAARLLGDVTVEGELDVPLLDSSVLGPTLRTPSRPPAAASGSDRGQYIFAIGGLAKRRGFSIRAVFDGWRGGIVPDHAEGPDRGESEPWRWRQCSPQPWRSTKRSSIFRVTFPSAEANRRTQSLELVAVDRIGSRSTRASRSFLSSDPALANRPRASRPGLPLRARAVSLRGRAKVDLAPPG